MAKSSTRKSARKSARKSVRRSPVRKVRCPKADPEKSQSVRRHRSKSSKGKKYTRKSYCRRPTGGNRRSPMLKLEDVMMAPSDEMLM